ncbi:MAG: TonB-dependent receptor [Pseudomonadota bacterium]|jgi:iron complex outermembrane receptor protein|nr:TonB-dependent receptor [Gammaproteobacteria bacterium]MEC8315204.1 TonB-dependent receptor [Pseudomonadota bacterium]MEC8798918.1 TonB-dependent receptor [Pseudomonadota bacterium]MED5349604.1 TonB-dependent receptor [Pseudomonadota bacterium]|tara:strand:+ start:2504 stop:5038 length:2535 start_codon:yes stop_codon:yes gene_type:complete
MFRTKIGSLAISLSLLTLPVIPSFIAAADEIEEVVAVGTRRDARSVGDSPAPVDVISGSDIKNQGAVDVDYMIRTLVPSFNVNTQPISDAATLIRPANLRGLPPDNMLVLLNGKRRHRGSVISFLGGGIADGAQGPDISAIPSIALKKVEVLRDGAAAQYGSDAIAGILNFVLNDSAEGTRLEIKQGEYSDGDGETWRIAANAGMPFTDDGYANFSMEIQEQDPTARSAQRGDAASLKAAGVPVWEHPFGNGEAQVWGSPKVSDDYKFTANIGLDLDDSKKFYLFSNYAEKNVLGGFFFRNPNNRTGVYDDGSDIRLIADAGQAAGGARTCASNVDAKAGNLVGAALAAYTNDANCFVFNELFPGGFTPSFGGDVTDWSIASGVSGTTDGGTEYDISVHVGENRSDFYIENTVNPSLGPQSPTQFNPGSYIQLEKNFNMDFVRSIPMQSFDLSFAYGFEWREEQFEIINGDVASFTTGPYFNQGFGIGSNGFAGFTPDIAGVWDQQNYAIYLDFEGDVTENLVLGLATRFEDFDTFGTTTNTKFSALWRATDSLKFRTTVSTGFRAPTPGQSNVSNVTTASISGTGELVQQGTLSPTNPIAVTAGGAALQPEESDNLSFGLVWDVTDALNVTIDAYEIEITDRIALTGNFSLSDAQRAALVAAKVPGASDMQTFRFFTNDFDTTTDGIDVVATYSTELMGGVTDFTFVYNETDTEVDRSTLLSASRINALEALLPESRWNLSAVHNVGDWTILARYMYVGESEYYYGLNDLGNPDITTLDDQSQLDLEFTRDFGNYQITLGAENITDEYPEKDTGVTCCGAIYPEFAPLGFMGAFYYLRVGIDL